MEPNSKRPCVVLLSGGLDSATVLAIARHEGFSPHTISFRYGQRHQIEIQRAEKIATALGATSHRVVSVDLGQFGGSALTSMIPVPKHDTAEEISNQIPVTYVPARNTVFLSLGLALAETLGSQDIFVGVNALDYSGYPDCRPEYIAAFEKLANLATKAAVEGTSRIAIHTPLIEWTKAQIIRRGLELGVDYSMTISCYDPDAEGRPCRHCDACLLRMRGFEQNGLVDPSCSSAD
ncbi:MAG: 7-cyano-7-deazaguanine synthase QueC [Planctomycetales bacterium]|nr:7-cyano-7-deazaguanine synthase QueC [Planctomycetales bacterium]